VVENGQVRHQREKSDQYRQIHDEYHEDLALSWKSLNKSDQGQMTPDASIRNNPDVSSKSVEDIKPYPHRPLGLTEKFSRLIIHGQSPSDSAIKIYLTALPSASLDARTM
jgi:hypothetical protein